MKPAHRRYNRIFTKINPEECKFHIHTLVYYGIKIWKQTLNVKFKKKRYDRISN
jgi:hypothetical protein